MKVTNKGKRKKATKKKGRKMKEREKEMVRPT
jgi:hypothetical protein